jgi:hypothetical protein
VSDAGSSGGGRRRRRRGRAGSGQPTPQSSSTGAAKGAAPRRRPGGADFWGRPGGEPVAKSIRPTSDPAAVPRSLGDPPIGHNPATAAGSLAVIYEEAVRAATALAAANGLLADDESDDDA